MGETLLVHAILVLKILPLIFFMLFMKKNCNLSTPSHSEHLRMNIEIDMLIYITYNVIWTYQVTLIYLFSTYTYHLDISHILLLDF